MDAVNKYILLAFSFSFIEVEVYFDDSDMDVAAYRAFA
jgi:hypothetical protein